MFSAPFLLDPGGDPDFLVPEGGQAEFPREGEQWGGTEAQLQAREAPSAAPSREPGSEGEGLRAGPPAWRQGSECRSLPSLVEEDMGALQGPGPPGLECLASACARGSSSSLWQQQEEGGLQEAAKAAECSHEPMGAEARLRADHTLEDIGLGGKRTRLENRAPCMRRQPTTTRGCLRVSGKVCGLLWTMGGEGSSRWAEGGRWTLPHWGLHHHLQARS